MGRHQGQGSSVGKHGATWLKAELDKMSLDQLWLLRGELEQVLRRKITKEIKELKWRLARLPSNVSAENSRWPPAKVFPKHRKLKEPT
jgi:hypothetical protein